MNKQIEAAIGQRARHATSKNELVNAILTSFAEHAVDPGNVSLEDMKAAVVVACRSARKHGGCDIPSCPA